MFQLGLTGCDTALSSKAETHNYALDHGKRNCEAHGEGVEFYVPYELSLARAAICSEVRTVSGEVASHSTNVVGHRVHVTTVSHGVLINLLQEEIDEFDGIER